MAGLLNLTLIDYSTTGRLILASPAFRGYMEVDRKMEAYI